MLSIYQKYRPIGHPFHLKYNTLVFPKISVFLVFHIGSTGGGDYSRNSHSKVKGNEQKYLVLGVGGGGVGGLNTHLNELI